MQIGADTALQESNKTKTMWTLSPIPLQGGHPLDPI